MRDSIVLSVIGLALLSAIVAVSAFLKNSLQRIPLYIFALAQHGHMAVLRAIEEIGGAADAAEVHQQLCQGGKPPPSTDAVATLLWQLSRAKLLYTVPAGESQRYLLTQRARQRLAGVARS
jgi:hypothetical protein